MAEMGDIYTKICMVITRNGGIMNEFLFISSSLFIVKKLYIK